MRVFFIRLLFCLSVTSLGAFADIVDYTFSTGAETPNTNVTGFAGNPCTSPYTSACVPGEIDGTGTPYIIQSVTLDLISTTTTFQGSVDNWVLTIQEEAPLTFGGYGPSDFGDLLIEDPNDAFTADYYGIVLGGTCSSDANWNNTSDPDTGTCASYSGHDGLTAGGLYESNNGLSGFQDGFGSRSNTPVWVGAGSNSTLESTTNTFSVDRMSPVNTSASTPYATYTITDSFSVASGTISDTGNLAISLSSYVCANYVIDGTPMEGPPVPEPRALFLIAPGLLLLSRRLVRSRAVQAI